MILQQLHYWLELPGPKSGKDHDGFHWVYKSCEELADEIGLSAGQVKRALVKLRDAGLLISINNPTKGWDRRYWHRINEDHPYMVQIQTIDGAEMNHAWHESDPSRDESAPSKVRRRTVEGPKVNRRRSESGPAIPKTTPYNTPDSTPSNPAETTQDTSSESTDDAAPKGSSHILAIDNDSRDSRRERVATLIMDDLNQAAEKRSNPNERVAGLGHKGPASESIEIGAAEQPSEHDQTLPPNPQRNRLAELRAEARRKAAA
jgi:hypothetical protein